MSETERARGRRPLWRVIPLLFGLGVAGLLQHYYGAHEAELLVVVPPEHDDGSGVVLRITRSSDHKLVVQVQQTSRAKEGHTIVIHTKLPRGRYDVEAWLENSMQTAFRADFEYQGEDILEVPLRMRQGD